MRTMYAKYPEYHTSGDNKDFVSFEAMEKSVEKYFDIITIIEKNEKYINKMPYCEPKLDKWGLYPTLGSKESNENFLLAMMWILNLSDGKNDLITISQKSKVPLKELFPVIEKLIQNGILEIEQDTL